MDKNNAVIEFLKTCPAIQSNPLFFNFAENEEGTNHFITETDKKKKTYIDGSVLKQYTFTIASYVPVAYSAIVGDSNFNDQNMENMAIVQEILDWIEEQADKANKAKYDLNESEKDYYPDFGSECIIEDMRTLTGDPDLDGIDKSVNPPIARYSIGVQIDYIDNTKKIWS